ncbi:hypothetical protein PTKIN_Ptkin08bG0087900 [Pterospermum kingtungense]
MSVPRLVVGQAVSELCRSCERVAETSKKGFCWFELKRSGMAGWGVCHQVKFFGPQGDGTAKELSGKVEEDYDEDDKKLVNNELISCPEVRKRKCLSSYKPRKERAPRCGKQKLNSGPNKVKQNKHNNSVERLSPARYKPAKESVLQIMNAEGAVLENPAKDSIGEIEEEYDEDDKTHVKTELISFPEVRKRKYLSFNQPRKERASTSGKQKLVCSPNKGKQINHKNSVERWSAERFKLAEESLLEILKAEGAVFEKPISRPALRMAARKLIGDTGLLDHLLKHVDGRVAPGGTDRFRRCYNTSGVMEYWLERADLADIRKEAGVSPFWHKPDGGPFHDSACAIELNRLREEMAKMKSNMQELVSKQQEQDRSNLIEQMHKELVKWKVKTDERLMEFSSSLNGMQSMCKELMSWKARVEQQLLEISNSLSSLQTSKQCTIFSPASERWEDWLESTNLDNFQGVNLAPWLESPELINFGQDVVQDTDVAPVAWSRPGHSPSVPICAQELDMSREEMAKIKSEVQELAPRRLEEDQANVTPDSSVTANSKLDLDNSLLLFQVMSEKEFFYLFIF